MTNCDRVAIITGAAQGLGKAISLRLADDGLDIVVNDLPSKAKELEEVVAEIRAKKRKAIAVVGDVTLEADVQKLVDTTVAELGSLDVMVANAGIGRSSLLTNTSVEEWDFMQAVNVRSVFLCFKAAAIQMIKQGHGGRIVAAASLAAKKGAAEWAPYCTSKFAVRGLTQSAAAELRPHGITVNAYAPGRVETSIWDDVDDSRESHGLKRYGSGFFVSKDQIIPVEDVAGLVSYLVKEESRFITGQTMNINAGLHFD